MAYKLLIQEIALGDLIPWARNARTHSKKQIGQIADSIRTFGFTNPVLIDEDNHILAGHGRVKAANTLGMDKVPCLRLDQMTEAEKRAYVLADNKLALNAGWDDHLLALELGELLDVDLDFGIEITGFSIPEIDALIENQAPEDTGDPRDDQVPARPPARCRPGDIWRLGPHRLICGNALDPTVLEMLMAGERARMVFSDPPYNVPIHGHARGNGKVRHREFAMASGEMTSGQFTAFLSTAFAKMAAVSLDGAIHFQCMDWRHLGEMLEAGRAAYSGLKNLIVWDKGQGGMGTFYRNRHELIFAFKVGTEPHLNTFELGQHGRYRTNVWSYRGVAAFKAGRQEELDMHPTVKPVSMIADAIKDVSGRGDIALDAFGGSGSTLIAAEKTGRRAFLCEIDPTYCDGILARYEAYTCDRAEQLLCGNPGGSTDRVAAT